MAPSPVRTHPRRLVSINEAADYLAISPRAMRHYVSIGALPGYRVAGRKLIRVDMAEVETLLLQRVPTVGGAA